jgi:hypothetical protein
MEQRHIFQPVDTFSWEINRSERTRQARWLVPVLEEPDGRSWFLERLKCPCSREEALEADVFHYCFPLRDVLTADYWSCRGNPTLEQQFIVFYNRLFGLPEDFGVDDVWRTAPGSQIRHPAAPGRAGWHEAFLQKHIPDSQLHGRARNARRMLGTEADILLITDSHVVLVECKFLSGFLTDEYERQLLMGETLARRLKKAFHYGLVAQKRGDPRRVQIDAPCVLWSEIEAKLGDIRAPAPQRRM